ncbi:MAG: DUF3237 family protein, partial [Pseudomonadota bacterium]
MRRRSTRRGKLTRFSWHREFPSSSGMTANGEYRIYASQMPIFHNDPLAAPALSYFADLAVDVGTPQVLGHGPRGVRRVVPIHGGTARGEGWTARVLP